MPFSPVPLRGAGQTPEGFWMGTHSYTLYSVLMNYCACCSCRWCWLEQLVQIKTVLRYNMNINCAPHAMPPSDTALPPHFILLTPDGGGDTVIKKMGCVWIGQHYLTKLSSRQYNKTTRKNHFSNYLQFLYFPFPFIYHHYSLFFLNKRG